MAASLYSILSSLMIAVSIFFSSSSSLNFFAVVENLQMVPAVMGPTLLMLGGGVPYHPHPPVAFPTVAAAITGTVPTVPAPYLLMPVPVPTMPTTQFQNTILVSTTAAAAAAPPPVMPPVQGGAVAAETDTVSPTPHTMEPELGTDTVGRTPEDDTSNT